ncbi:MAG: hypothetical protein JWM98_2304 [Thermoleophilia bacterium]|nr:hypothetical protein [Thermoleophilia bacterium]
MTMISRTPPPIMSPIQHDAVPSFGHGVPVGPPTDDGGAVGPPPIGSGGGWGTPPTAPPTPPTTPPASGVPTTPTVPRTDLAAGMVDDVTEAARLVGRAGELLQGVPTSDHGDESTKELRIRVFKTNMAAQKRIERQIDAGNPSDILSQLRRADASLEDANWQLAKKPSPDGRFNGVDVPGAVRDTAEGARILGDLLRIATSSPTKPGGGGGIPQPPTDGPDTPPPSGHDDGGDTQPTPPTAPTTPPAGGGDDGYPDESEFPPINNAGG